MRGAREKNSGNLGYWRAAIAWGPNTTLCAQISQNFAPLPPLEAAAPRPTATMEPSPANQLPEADALPDGFVESSTEPPPPADADYKDAFLDLDQSLPESLQPDGGSDGVDEPPVIESLPQTRNLGSGPPGAEDSLLLPMPVNDDAPIESAESKSVGIVEVEVQNAKRDNERCLELHGNCVKERSTTEPTERLKNQKLEGSEAKRKVGKRSIKSEKELLEFTLRYQKVIAERDAAVAVRERLESLCRELQRQNKMLMDECQRVSTEGQSMRSELSTKFNDAIKDIGIKLEEQKNESISQLKENDMLRNKLKHLADQYTLSEQHFAQKLKQKTLELQIAELKIQQQQERSAQENTQMKLYAEQVTQLLATEKELRTQLSANGEKFQQFQDALLKSNEMFDAFKQEMEKMTKLTKELRKENEFLKSKCEKSDFALVKLIEEREQMKPQLEKLKNQKEKLESLCRSLQAERKQNSAGSATTDPDAIQANVDSPDLQTLQL